MTALLLGAEERAALDTLRQIAAERPVDVRRLMATIAQTGIKAEHMQRMTAQTVRIPANFAVTFSIETGHRAGTCRHMSMSVGAPGRVPNAEALWLVAEALGFTGGLDACTLWKEDLQGHGLAINVVQPLAVGSAGEAS
jgi:hypothetical protein